MTPILILEAFGELPPTALIETERDRERRERESPPTGVSVVGLLHMIFDARAELMGWSTTSPRSSWARRASRIWPSSHRPSSGLLFCSHSSGSACGGITMGQMM